MMLINKKPGIYRDILKKQQNQTMSKGLKHKERNS